MKTVLCIALLFQPSQGVSCMLALSNHACVHSISHVILVWLQPLPCQSWQLSRQAAWLVISM